MTDVLAAICAAKRDRVAVRKLATPLAQVEAAAAAAPAPRGFARALTASIAAGRHGLIAEIKRASPSKGAIRTDADPAATARAYAAGGAACLSVLTEQDRFQGDDADLLAARAACTLPILRKDFMLEPYQIIESRALGADCILLILAALSDADAVELAALARSLGMDILAEVHDRAEVERALALQPTLLGINNRNLKTLAVDLQTTLDLAPLVAAGVPVVCESGLSTRADLDRVAAIGVRRFLIGEALMRENDPAATIAKLIAA